jgi:hypothetical protein
MLLVDLKKDMYELKNSVSYCWKSEMLDMYFLKRIVKTP